MLEKKLQCLKCDRKFAREGHLARHLNAIHGRGGAKRDPKPKAMKRRGRGRPPGSVNRAGKRVGRPPGGKLGLGKMSLEQLTDLIASAKEHAKNRLQQMLAAFN